MAAQHTNRTALTSFALSAPAMLVAAAGPLALVLAAGRAPWAAPTVLGAQVVALLAFAPFNPVGVPALLLQDLRDLAASSSPRTPAAVPVGWYLYFSGPARVLAFSWANLAGLALAAHVALG